MNYECGIQTVNIILTINSFRIKTLLIEVDETTFLYKIVKKKK